MKANTVKIVRSLLLLALALSGGALFAQTIPVNPRIGKISPEECGMSVYPLDTAAAAVVLYEEHAVRMHAEDYPQFRDLVKSVNKAYESTLVLKKNP